MYSSQLSLPISWQQCLGRACSAWSPSFANPFPLLLLPPELGGAYGMGQSLGWRFGLHLGEKSDHLPFWWASYSTSRRESYFRNGARSPEWCSGLRNSERAHKRVLLGLFLIEENAIQYGFSCGYVISTTFPQVGT